MAETIITCPYCGEKHGAGAPLDGVFACRKCRDEFRVSPAGPVESFGSGGYEEGTQTVAAPASKAPGPARTGETGVPVEWKTGDVILNLYEVMGVFGEGGMGKVYRVHHRDWNVDLAVKCPTAGILRTGNAVENFVSEAETWINLGLYPHIVCCHYVRTLGGIPRVFAECVEGGSLKDWIDDGRLYEGGPGKAIPRILDIAIQFAWGVHYAHEKGLIHQDIKPANVMMTPDGVAKVTDFGLARARAAAGEALAEGSRRDFSVSFGGMTPAYCSPEQAELADPRNAETPPETMPELTRQTDIWSWAVSVFEMFCGESPCRYGGQFAAKVFDSYLEAGPPDTSLPEMPAAAAALLKTCFRLNPQERPRNMHEAADKLKEIYKEVSGENYLRQEPEPAGLKADSLNNKAVSMLDLGNREEAERLFEETLKAEPAHLEATYNHGLLLWRSFRISDNELARKMREACACHQNEWLAKYLLGLVHLERLDAESAAGLLEQAAEAAPEAADVKAALDTARAGAGKWRRHIRTFDAAADMVASVAISPDGKYGLSGGYSEAPSGRSASLRLWDLDTGNCLGALDGHAGKVASVAVSPDGKHGLSGGDDKTLKLWQLAGCACLRTFEGHADKVTAVAITPDGKYGLSGSADKTLKLWELASGNCLRTFAGHAHCVTSAAITPDGKHGLSGSADKTLKLWELASGKCLRTFEGHAYGVNSAAVTPDGKHGLSGSADKTLKLWELASGDCLQTFEGHAYDVNSVAVSPDGEYGLSGSDDKTLKLWELFSGNCLRTFEEHTYSVTAAAISADGLRGLSGSRDGRLMLHGFGGSVLPARYILSRPETSEEIRRNEQRGKKHLARAEEHMRANRLREAYLCLKQAQDVPGYAREPAVLEMRERLLARGRHSRLKDAWRLRTFEGHADRVTSVAISPDGRHGLSGSADKTLRLWELATGKCLRVLEGHAHGVTAAAISLDGKYVLSGSGDKPLRLWELATGNCIMLFEGHGWVVSSAAVSPDGRYGLSGSYDKTLKLWELATGKCLRTFEGHADRVTSVAISPDGRHGLSGSADKTLRLWELATGKCLRLFEGHADSVEAAAISPDGKYGFSGILWELATGTCPRTFDAGTVNAAAVSPDGKYALSGSYDQSLKLCELATGKCIWEFGGSGGSVNAVAISPDGNAVLTGNSDRTLRLWYLDWDHEFPDEADWDDEAKPYLENFLALHVTAGPDGAGPAGGPVWTEEDFQNLLADLRRRGCGWLRPEGVGKKLKKLAAEKRHS